MKSSIQVSESQSIKDQCQKERYQRDSGTHVVELDFTFTTFKLPLVESGHVRSRQVRSRSRIASWRIARPYAPNFANPKSMNIRGVNYSGVITARSGRSPSVDIFAAHHDRHRVFSFNTLNFTPSNLDFLKWISNDNSFITKSNFWTQKKKISASSQKYSPANRNKKCFCSATYQSRDDFAHNYEINYKCRNVNSSSSKSCRVIHSTILSHFSTEKGLTR